MYRPNGWDSNEMHLDMLRANVDAMDGGAFIEAGADAMLVKLKQAGIQIDEKQNPTTKTMGNLVDFLDTCKNGWLVFIPDES